eukprot:7803512-Alexandrium_andersonii.AAC.1
MAILGPAGYRSAPSILPLGWRRRRRASRSWSDGLALAQREANRAAARGLRPPKRPSPFSAR